MALSGTQSGPNRSMEIPRQGAARVLDRLWGKGSVIGAVLLVSILGWLVLWRMVSDHAALDGGYGALGPGMAFIDDVVRSLGGNGLPEQGIWADICRAFAVGSGTQAGVWPLHQLWSALVMWAVMSLAMMLPTALPFMAAFEDIRSAAREKGMAPVPGWIFPAGYLIVWLGIAVAASLLQWGLGFLISGEKALIDAAPLIGGVMLVLAGLYQWSALKQACLSQCRSPMRFFMSNWRDGSTGAFRMGLHHGLYCVGCCWAMMALMFVGGVMNLVWMAVLTLVMLLEKIAPGGKEGDVSGKPGMSGVITHGVGIVFVTWGVLLLVTGFMQIGFFDG